MEIIIYGLWGSIFSFAICVLVLVTKLFVAIDIPKSERHLLRSILPWIIAVAVTGAALLLAIMMLQAFSRGFWK